MRDPPGRSVARRTTFVSGDRRAELGRRLRRARGQIDGIERMLADDRPCAEILQQIAAAQEALRAAGKLMIRNYLETCATRAIRDGREKEIYDELAGLIDRAAR